MPELIEKVKYCSDSGGEWKFDDPEKIINIKNMLEIIDSSIWWTHHQIYLLEKKLHF